MKRHCIQLQQYTIIMEIVIFAVFGLLITAAEGMNQQQPKNSLDLPYKQQLCSGLCVCDKHLQHINCTETGINNLSNVAIPKSAISLMFDKNTIDRIPDNIFHKLPKLEFLALRNNIITEIDNNVSICSGKHLYHLFLDFNYISTISANFLKDCNELRTLQIKNNYLIVEEVAKVLKYVPQLETLDLSSNQFQNVSKLPKEFAELKHLKYLYLNNMEIRYLSENFFSGLNKSNIIELGIADNAIVKVSNKSFTDMLSLDTLDLSSTNINVQNAKDIFYGLQDSVHLHEIRLQYVFIYDDDDGVLKEDIFEYLHNISSLKILHMEGNYGGFHGSLHKNFFSHLHHLQELYLDHNELRTIHPKTFNRLHKLKKLSLSKNFLSCLVDCQFLQSEAMFPSLEYLDLSDNVIDNSAGYVVFSSHYFPKLKHLSLRENRLSKIQQDTFNKIRSLRFLDLSENPIRVIASGAFVTLERLKTLIMENCHYIEFIPPRVFAGLNYLEVLKLNANGISVLSNDAWEGVKSLLHLEMSKNNLGGSKPSPTFNSRLNFTLPGNNLTYVDLSHNNIEFMPYELLLNQPKLGYINLNHNRIFQLQANQLRNLSKLHTLDLSYNDILTLDYDSFKGLKRLSHLNLEGNPFYCDCAFSNRDGNWLQQNYEHILYNSENTKCAGPTNVKGIKVVSYLHEHKLWACNSELQDLLILILSLIGLLFALLSVCLCFKIIKTKKKKIKERNLSSDILQQRRNIYKHKTLKHYNSDSQIAQINSIETVDSISQVSHDQISSCDNISTPSVRTKKKSKKKTGCLLPLFDKYKEKGITFVDRNHASTNGFISKGDEPLMEHLHESQSSI